MRLSSQYSTRKGSENSFQLLQFGIQLQLHVSIKLDSVAILGLIRGGKCAEQKKLKGSVFTFYLGHACARHVLCLVIQKAIMLTQD